MAEPLWWRTRWMEAVWSSDLKPMQKLVAAVYADHAHDQRKAWVTLERLMQRSRLGRSQATTWRRSLVEKGWLVELEPHRQHHAAVYLLAIPENARVPENRHPGDQPECRETGTLSGSRVPESRPQSAGISAPECRETGTNPSTYPSSHPSSSSRAVEIVFRAWPPEFDEDEDDDEREENREIHRETIAEFLPGFLSENNVKAALPWLKACDEAGDLGRNFMTYCQDRNEQASKDRETTGIHKRAQERIDAKITRVIEAVGSEPEARHTILAEAKSMCMDHSPYTDVVLDSVLMNLQREAS